MTGFLVPLNLTDFAEFDSYGDVDGLLRVPASERMYRHWVAWMFDSRERRYVGLHESRD